MSAPLADTRALARIARRIADAVEEETACFEAGLPPRGADFSDRKALLLLEFTRAARGCAPPFDERLREALARMKAAVARNHAVLGLHLGSSLPHVGADGVVGDTGQVVLVDQPVEDPGGGVPLLARRLQVGHQHLLDHRFERVKLGPAVGVGRPGLRPRRLLSGFDCPPGDMTGPLDLAGR